MHLNHYFYNNTTGWHWYFTEQIFVYFFQHFNLIAVLFFSPKVIGLLDVFTPNTSFENFQDV